MFSKYTSNSRKIFISLSRNALKGKFSGLGMKFGRLGNDEGKYGGEGGK